MSVTVKIDTAVLDNIIRTLGINTEDALGAVAFEVESQAKTRAPVDTGALRASIHTSRIKSDLFWVSDGVEYGIYQELGTYKMGAQPFLAPATEVVAHQLSEKFKRLFP